MSRTPALWLAATRPAFLSVTFVGVALGLACSVYNHTFWSLTLAATTLLFALIGHAGANVINDYYDARSGCDAANTDRIAPFTGGSRFIQNGLLTERQTQTLGYALLLAVIPAGLWLLNQSGPDLFWIGLIGLFCGWAYSATPLKLQSQGLGEIAIILAWLMIVLGSSYVQSQTMSPTAIFAGLAYAPLVANVLFVNQIPDRVADASVNKNTLIVRWGPSMAPWGSLALYLLSLMALIIGVALEALPMRALLSLGTVIPAALALSGLFKNSVGREQLLRAIPATIVSTLVFGTILTAGLIL